MILEGEPLLIDDCEGNIIEAKPLSTGKRRRFKQFFALAARLLDEHEGSHDKVYDENKYFRHAVHTCLGLFGIDGRKVDLRLIIMLLFSMPAVDEEGNAAWGNGILIDWEFPTAASEGTGFVMEDIEPELADLAIGWIANGGSLNEFMDLSERVAHRDLMKLVTARGQLLEHHASKESGKKPTPTIEPKIVNSDGSVEAFDMQAEFDKLREDVVSEMADKVEWKESVEWKEVKIAGIG